MDYIGSVSVVIERSVGVFEEVENLIVIEESNTDYSLVIENNVILLEYK